MNYCAGAMRQQENLLAVSRERARTFSAELQALIGYRTSGRFVGHVNVRDPRHLLQDATG